MEGDLGVSGIAICRARARWHDPGCTRRQSGGKTDRMKPLLRLFCAAAAAASLLQPAVVAESPKAAGHPDSSAWPMLFKADLSDAEFGKGVSKGIWTVKDGVLTASEDQAIWSAKEFENFTLDLEFKTADGTNSGVIIYASDINDWIPNAVEIQIADDHSEQWSKAAKTWQCAAVFGHLAPTKSAVKKPGEWNRMTIQAMGQKLTVTLNGETVTEMDMALWKDGKKNPDGSEIPAWMPRPFATLGTKGRIGLQGKHAGAPIFFRNVRIKAAAQ